MGGNVYCKGGSSSSKPDDLNMFFIHFVDEGDVAAKESGRARRVNVYFTDCL